jgi:TRAP-type C4-dicarboxylate transport system permease small subunit
VSLQYDGNHLVERDEISPATGAGSRLRFLNRIEKALCSAELWLSAVLLVVVVVLMLVQVVLRYIFETPLRWAPEASNLMFVWFGLLSSALVLAERDHVALDLLRAKMRGLAGRAADVAFDLMSLAVLVLLLPAALRVLSGARGPTSMPWIPAGLAWSILPVTLCLMIVHLVIRSGKDIWVLFRPEASQ